VSPLCNFTRAYTGWNISLAAAVYHITSTWHNYSIGINWLHHFIHRNSHSNDGKPLHWPATVSTRCCSVSHLGITTALEPIACITLFIATATAMMASHCIDQQQYQLAAAVFLSWYDYSIGTKWLHCFTYCDSHSNRVKTLTLGTKWLHGSISGSSGSQSLHHISHITTATATEIAMRRIHAWSEQHSDSDL